MRAAPILSIGLAALTVAPLGPRGVRPTPVDLLAAAPGTLAVRDRVRFRRVFDCPALHGQGDMAVAAVPELSRTDSVVVAVALRDPGGAFGSPSRLGRATLSGRSYDARLSANGDAVVAWAQPGARRGRPLVRIVAARRSPGAAFGPAEALTPWVRVPEPEPYLSVAAGIDGGGAATVAWTAPAGRMGDDVRVAAARAAPAGGSFGPPRTVAPEQAGEVLRSVLDLTNELDIGLSAALSPDGRAVLAWSGSRRLPDRPLAPVAAAGTLAGGFGTAAVLGSPVRGIAGVSALVLPGGVPAVAWADNAAYVLAAGGGAFETDQRDGRIHVARSGAPARPAAQPPAVRLRARRVQRLREDQGVRLRVHCTAACDLRAHLRTSDGLVVGKGATFTAAGTRTLRLVPVLGPLAPRRPRRTVVRVRVSAPGSPVTRTLRLPLRLVRRG